MCIFSIFDEENDIFYMILHQLRQKFVYTTGKKSQFLMPFQEVLDTSWRILSLQKSHQNKKSSIAVISSLEPPNLGFPALTEFLKKVSTRRSEKWIILHPTNFRWATLPSSQLAPCHGQGICSYSFLSYSISKEEVAAFFPQNCYFSEQSVEWVLCQQLLS